MDNILEVRKVRKVYGSRGRLYPALDGINLDIKAGEFLGIMGPSGAGKTTLLNVIATIDRPSSGSIKIDGVEVAQMDETALAHFRRSKLGFIFQDFNLLDSLTIKENIVLPLALARIKAEEIEQRVGEAAHILGIDDILNKYPCEVSGGQKQRTAAARAIINRPALILADEPTGALDSKSSAELLECLSDLNETRKAAVMLVTHDAFAASYCKRIMFIKDGRLFTELVRGGTRKEFFVKIMDVLAFMGGEGRELI